MKTLAILTRRQGASAESFERLVTLEIQAVWRGMSVGTVRAVHGLADGPGAAVELETASAQEAREFIDTLPFVVENLLDVQIVPLTPFPPYAALAELAQGRF
jgi:hypothetical protein